MPEKVKKNVNFPLIIFLVTLGLLTPKLLYLKQIEHEDTISKHSMATKDYVGLYELGGTIAGLQPGETLTLRNNEEKIGISLNGVNSSSKNGWIMKQPMMFRSHNSLRSNIVMLSTEYRRVRLLGPTY